MSYPLVYKDTPVIKLAICYNPFIPNDLERHELVYDVSKTLADYMDGLPEEVAWSVGYNGEIIEKEQWSEIKPAAFSNIIIVRTPEGGGDGAGKNILRIVALIGLMVIAPWAGTAIGVGLFDAGIIAASSVAMATAIGTAAVTVVGGALINALLPPATINPDSATGTPNYSINGPKNTAREGVVAPIVYGRYRVAGNVTDLFTRNIGDDQYLLMRVLLNDGPSANVSDIQLNNQPITSFDNVAYYVNYGSSSEVPTSWFNTSTKMYNLNRKIRATAWTYKTIDPVDRLRIDVNFPIGLIHVSSKGNKYDNTVKLEFQYRPIDNAGNPTGGWQYLPLEAESRIDTVSTGVLRANAANSVTATVLPSIAAGDSWNVTAQIRKVGDTAWTDWGTRTGNYSYSSTYGRAGFWGGLEDDLEQTTGVKQAPTLSWEIRLPNAIDSYEIRFVGGTIQENTSSISYNTSTKDNVPGTVNNLTVTRQTNDAFSLTYQSSTLTRGRYELSIRRETEDETDLNNNPNLAFVSDIGEIDNGNVSYDGLTMLALRIKINDQLSSQPTVSAVVDGSLLKIYDEDGNVTNTAWSDNPADIVLDILTNPFRGGTEPLNRIIFPKFVEWREFCAANNLKFNGVFDFVTTRWDAMQSVGRIGHGAIVPQGTRYTVAIDRAADPVMLFTGSNMYSDTFQKVWVNLTDRANEIQQSYYDAENGYRQRTVRIPDAAAQGRGDPVKPANPSGFGLTSATQATSEAEYQARQNSYVTHTVSFDAPIEAIGLQIGDVALVQHDSIKYASGVGGRLEAGSTVSVVNLDRPVTMQAGKTYAIMINTDAIQVGSGNVTNVTGNKVSVAGLPGTLPRIRRLQQAGKDREVIKVSNLGSGTYSFTLDDATGFVNGQTATLWDTDVIIEKDVVLAVGETSQVTLASSLAAPPAQYANFLFGEKTSVKKPYRLAGISTTGDMYRRTLNFTNYDARIYAAGSWGVPQLTEYVVPKVGNVRNVLASWDSHPAPTAVTIPVTLSWQVPEGTTAYGGADIYLAKPDGTWATAGSVRNSTTFQTPVNRGGTVKFKVVAFDTSDNRAIFSSAPTVEVDLSVVRVKIDEPTNLVYEVKAFADSAKILASWTKIADPDTDGYDVAYVRTTQAQYDAFVAAANASEYPAVITDDDAYIYAGRFTDTTAEINSVAVGWYVLRVRAVKGFSTSEWVYKAMRVDYPALPTQVTGLRLANATPAGGVTFSSADAIFAWDDVLTMQSASSGITGSDLANYLLDYKVEVLDTTNNVLRTEYTNSPSYTYSFDKNQADTNVAGKVARRNFRLRVTIRGKQGQSSSATVLEVNNPPPALVSVGRINGVGSTTLKYTPPSDQDFGGIAVWLSTSSGFTPSDANLVFKGSGAAVFPTTDDVIYYCRYGFYDTFGTDSIIVSNEFSFNAGANITTALAQTSEEIARVYLSQELFRQRQEALNYTGDGYSTQLKALQAFEKSDDAWTTLNIMGAVNPTKTAFIMDMDKVQSNDGKTFAVRFSSIETTFGELQASVTQLAESIDGVSAAYTLSVNANGHIAGLKLTADGTTSSFTVVANQYKLVDPSDPANIKTPFFYNAGQLKITSDVIIDGDLLVTGSITTGKLLLNSVTEEATVSVGGINDLSTEKTITSITINPQGGRVKILARLLVDNPSGSEIALRVKVFRNGVNISGSRGTKLNLNFATEYMTWVSDPNPGNSTVTYTLTAQTVTGVNIGDTGGSGINRNLFNADMSVEVYKR